MTTDSEGRAVVHKDSGHVAPGPTPAMCLGPPLTPAGTPTPGVPFAYIAKSSTGKDCVTKTKFNIGGNAVLKQYSVMDVERPGNQPCQTIPGGMDIVSLATEKFAVVMMGSCSTLAEGEKISVTGDVVALNLLFEQSKVFQCSGGFVGGADFDAITSSAQARLYAAKQRTDCDPVSLTTGEVLDERDDLVLPGKFPFVFRRHFCSSFAKIPTSFGRGGWQHCFEETITIENGVTVLHCGDLRDVGFPEVPPRGVAYHRGRRLRLTRSPTGEAFAVLDLVTRLTRIFSPLTEGEPATLREVRDAWGNKIALHHDAGRLAKIVDTAGRDIVVAYDAKSRIDRLDVVVEGKTVRSVRYSYGDTGELASCTDAAGGCEKYAYDGHHRIVAKTLPNGRKFHYRYDRDGEGRCIKTWGDDGFQGVALEFDTSHRKTLTHGTPQPRRVSWNSFGLVTKEETLGGELSIEYAYDEDMNVVSEKRGNGEPLTFEYDEHGNPTKLVDEAGRTQTLEYFDDLPVRHVGPKGETRMQYDAFGALAGVKDALGIEHWWSYDRNGRVTGMYGPDGPVWLFEYDAHHNVTKVTDAVGATSYRQYDQLGNMIARVDPLGRTTRVTHDPVGRITSIQDPDGSTQTLRYDAFGNLVEHESREGLVSKKEWTGIRSLAREIDPEGHTWEFEYDSYEQVRSAINPKGEKYELRYDRAGRVVEETEFSGASRRYQYTRTGKLARIDHADDTYQEIEYDDHGFIVCERTPHGPAKFARDDAGYPTAGILVEHDGPIESRFERDEYRRIVADVQGERAVRYRYDARGRRAERTLLGQTTRYEYDAKDRLRALDHEGFVVELERDAAGQEILRRYRKSGLVVERAYDERRRLTRHWATDIRGAVLIDRRWTYDREGRPLVLEDARWGATRYRHDLRDFLVEQRQEGVHEVFDYDAAGSLIDAHGSAREASPWSVAMGNVLLRARDLSFEYDLRKQRTRRTKTTTGEEVRYFWDCRGRLREARLPGGDVVEFKYDVWGRRIRKTIVPARAGVASRVIDYVWDEDTLAAELDSERGLRVFVHAPGTVVPLLQAERGVVFSYVNERNGLPRELLDEAGRIAWRGRYSAWGELLEVDAPVAGATPCDGSPFRLYGQYFDEETRLCCTRFRYFDPETARWISADPLGILGGENLFAFNRAPTLHADPYGNLGPYDLGGYSEFPGSTEGHEMLRHSWLMQQGLAGETRGGTPISAANPSIGLPKSEHQDVHRQDGAVGQDYRNYRQQSAEDTINRSVDGLRRGGSPQAQAQADALRDMALAQAPKFICK